MKKTLLMILLTIIILIILGGVAYFLGPKFYKLVFVKKYQILTSYERSLCRPTFGEELIELSTCVVDTELLYKQETDTNYGTDSGRTNFMTSDGKLICSDDFLGACDKELRKKWENCSWKILCSNYNIN